MQDAAAAAGDAGLPPQLWAALLRAHSLLPPLPMDAAFSFRDDSQHEASIAGAPPPAALSLQVRRLLLPGSMHATGAIRLPSALLAT